ncbi:hypothetical protein AN189_17555 [Loktanella sp. 3ANDIMAR09]|uniref:hypothetical protein n=1 Tax=Loktanella sp. 3ANDIMAR09 TaxID=1225657 RepID=UPI0006FE53F1|nr:hypothetical protein [Loktanella sp. 3ANDIMAR09]KQI67030.1 hypothetical protein AN189_17555 [Loktanella sp. 3ANDIMAR09]
MTFEIATVAQEEPQRPYGSFGKYEHDYGMNVDLSDWTRADRFKRKCIETIWSIENANDLDGYLASQDFMLDALHLAHPNMAAEIREHETECRAGLANATTPSAQADTDPAAPGNVLGIEF